MSKRHKNPVLQKVFAAALALAYLLTYLGTYFHMMEERHVVCAEHGHLIHADAFVEQPAVGEQEGTRLFAVPTHEDHEHCAEAFVFQAKRIIPQSLSLPPVHFVEVGGVFEVTASLSPIRGPTSHDVLRYAPKTSPPLV